MNTRRLAISVVFVTVLALPCWAIPQLRVTWAETYDGLLEEASWRVAAFDTVVPSGGSPGAYLRVSGLDTFGPRISTVPWVGPQYLGNYRYLGVIGLGVDINLFSVDFPVDGRPVSLYLKSNMNTDDPSDDCEAVNVGPRNVPRPGTGWKSYDFRVPSLSTTVPQGWVMVGACGGLSPDDAWNFVIRRVSEASFYFGEPDYSYIFQIWDVGFDNPRMTIGKGGSGP